MKTTTSTETIFFDIDIKKDTISKDSFLCN